MRWEKSNYLGLIVLLIVCLAQPIRAKTSSHVIHLNQSEASFVFSDKD